eukprot:6185774-Pleurochrysis_carterae.AAC.1
MGWLQVGGAKPRSTVGATRTPELRKRSASAPQVRMLCNCNFGNCAYDNRSATEGRAHRQFGSNCWERARVEMLVLFGLEVKTLNSRSRSRYVARISRYN